MASMQQKRNNFFTTANTMGFTDFVSRQDALSIAKSAGVPVPNWFFTDAKYKSGRHGFYKLPNKGNAAKAVAVPSVASESVATAVESVATAMDYSRGVQTIKHEVESGSLIPSVRDTYVTYGHFTDIKKILGSGKFFPMFITGLSGNGKTTMVEQACAELKRECIRVNITNFTDEDDLVGGFRLVGGESVWSDAPCVVAMERGAVLLLDELDYGDPRKINCLQSVLEHGKIFIKKMNRYVTAKAGFTVVATGNTKGQGGEGSDKFTGTNILNEAFLERFRITVEQEYPSKTVEKKIVMNLMNKNECLDEVFADNLVKWADIIRKSFFEGATDDIITTRRLEHIVEDFAIFGDRLKAVEHCISRFSKDSKESFLNLYTKVDAEVGGHSAEDAALAEAEAARIAENATKAAADALAAKQLEEMKASLTPEVLAMMSPDKLMEIMKLISANGKAVV